MTTTTAAAMVMMGTTTWTTKLTKTERRRLKRLSSFCLCGELPQLLDCTSNYVAPHSLFVLYLFASAFVRFQPVFKALAFKRFMHVMCGTQLYLKSRPSYRGSGESSRATRESRG